MSTYPQPTLLPEIKLTDAEIAFIEESPPEFFPENQNSNFGFIIRKLWCDHIQEIANQQYTMFLETFAQSSTLFLDEWEVEYAVTVNPPLDVAQRRAIILSLLRRGLFTRAIRAGVVENFIIATFGTVIEFIESGIPFVPGGIPFASEAGDVSTLYSIVENLTNFSYQVRIKNTVAPNEFGLRQALDRLNPAGISYTIVYVAVP